MTIGWKLDRAQRAALLDPFPPRYSNAVADHVTFTVHGSTPPPHAGEAFIVGHVDDGQGVEAMIVAIGGSTERPDGKVWHITWSLADGRAARESNDVISEHDWRTTARFRLNLTPACW